MDIPVIGTVSMELVRLVLGLAFLAAFIGGNGVVLVWLERKIAGHIQRRPGPFEVGPHGLLQTLADALKMVGKQLVTPAGADKFLFWLAPLMAFMPVMVLFLPISWGEDLFILDTDLGLVLILAFAGINVIAVLVGGWASNNKYGVLGAARAVAQSVAYEIPLLLSVLAVSFMTGSLHLGHIVEGQGNWPWQWNLLLQPVAFVVYFISGLAETNRAPFDLPEGESELTAGFHTEYSGMGFGVFMLAEYANMLVVCAVASILFLGGWKGPFLPGPWWLLAKIYALMALMMWCRWTFPRVRFDQLLNFNWKWLIPITMANLFVTAVLVKVF